MNQRILEAYLEYSGEQARAGIIDDSLTENLDDDRPLEDRIIDILRAAGRLPEGWGHEWAWQQIPVPREMTATPIRKPVVGHQYARLGRTYRDDAA
jgi:hypothetical protein